MDSKTYEDGVADERQRIEQLLTEIVKANLNVRNPNWVNIPIGKLFRELGMDGNKL